MNIEFLVIIFQGFMAFSTFLVALFTYRLLNHTKNIDSVNSLKLMFDKLNEVTLNDDRNLKAVEEILRPESQSNNAEEARKRYLSFMFLNALESVYVSTSVRLSFEEC